jgi:hypothetical protein
MKLASMAKAYRRSGDLAWQRVKELRQKAQEVTDEEELKALEERIRILRGIYRDTQETARILERYYKYRGYIG